MKISISSVNYSTRVQFSDSKNAIFGDKQTCYVEWQDEYKKGHYVALVEASQADHAEFGPGTFRVGKGEMQIELVVKIDPKGMKLYFVDNEHYVKTDEVKWQTPVLLKKLVVFNRRLFEQAYRTSSTSASAIKKEVILNRYRELEADNAHSEALLLLAEHYGTKRDVEVVKALITLRDFRGHVTKDDSDLAYKIHKRLWEKAQ